METWMKWVILAAFVIIMAAIVGTIEILVKKKDKELHQSSEPVLVFMNIAADIAVAYSLGIWPDPF